METQHKHSEFTLSVNQVKEIYNTPTNFRDRVLIKTLYYGGLRRFEAANLNVNDIDMGLNRIVVVKGKGMKISFTWFTDSVNSLCLCCVSILPSLLKNPHPVLLEILLNYIFQNNSISLNDFIISFCCGKYIWKSIFAFSSSIIILP